VSPAKRGLRDTRRSLLSKLVPQRKCLRDGKTFRGDTDMPIVNCGYGVGKAAKV